MTDGARPPGFALVRRIGPFDAASLPMGLLANHSLKPGTWGWLQLTSGGIRLVWERRPNQKVDLVAPASVLIPPEAPHHLEVDGPFTVEISFLARAEPGVGQGRDRPVRGSRASF